MTLNEREKELELFNAFVKKELPELFEKQSNGNFFAKVTYDSMFGAWLGAKAQAVPEGYCLVPKVPTEKMLQAYEHYSVAPMSTLSKTGYKAMIEASESGAEG
ncbi:hypothetical protein [Acinetobacter baumannii]|uniref:hypothetical protein n=1 Tax=Acinetobacter baumannii TaxID=470 RepID=UPI00132FFD32|nr:hypothetical protein [Acinetobacter baumannii]KAF0599527.1 hypothetical protein AB71190_03447 [Acinetobacter baumannii]